MCVCVCVLKTFETVSVVCCFCLFIHYFSTLFIHGLNSRCIFFFTYTQIHTLFGINNHTLCTTQNNIGLVMTLSSINYLNWSLSLGFSSIVNIYLVVQCDVHTLHVQHWPRNVSSPLSFCLLHRAVLSLCTDEHSNSLLIAKTFRLPPSLHLPQCLQTQLDC